MSVQENLELGGYVRRDGTALRADIARGLLARPTLLVLDEPSLGLAPHLVREVMLLVRRIREEGTTVLLVEQNARQALAPADHAYVLEQGRVSLDGTGRALLSNPAVVRAYLGVAPV
jgi:branched-chain amino acid transport system ATP-binding protein